MAALNGWSNEEQLATLPMALAGRALLVFEKKEVAIKTIEEAFLLLTAEFDAPRDREAAMKEFYSCRCGIGLDPALFADKLERLLRRGLPSLSNDDVDSIATNQFINGLPEHISEKLRTLFAGKTHNLLEAVATARDLSRTPSEAQMFAVEDEPSASARMEALEANFGELAVQVAALGKRLSSLDEAEAVERPGAMSDASMRNQRRRGAAQGRPVRNDVQCYNCSGRGHIARFCPSPIMKKKTPAPGNFRAGDRMPTAIPQNRSSSAS